MSTFFHGWRRKIGVLTLLMACVLIALWVHAEIQIKNDPDPLVDSANVLFVIIAPLTLLSAWLLLSKPREKLTAPKPDSLS